MKGHVPLIIGMMLVTYIPRLVPLLAVSGRALHPRVRRFLTYIPCTVLGALIVSGVAQAGPGMTGATLGGVLFDASRRDRAVGPCGNRRGLRDHTLFLRSTRALVSSPRLRRMLHAAKIVTEGKGYRLNNFVET